MNLATIIDKNVPAIGRAKAELTKLGEQLDSAKTYDAIRKIERQTEAISLELSLGRPWDTRPAPPPPGPLTGVHRL